MEEQELKEFCKKALEKVLVAGDRQERFKTATEFADRLYVAGYLSEENRSDFVKNELVFHFALTEQETDTILEDMKDKEKRVNDKLQILRLKAGLKYVEIYKDNLLSKGLNLKETKKIIEYVDNEYNINDKQMLKHFILDSLCVHFELNNDEVEDIKKFCEERGIV